ncbi:MAG: hypothetical protein Solumvirus1_9 [Solumvirus sp.]|uniref:Uncharacterized protein n=1 Tax=Solumvirus sp. TaxID=2487773 RepID=A0A3G5AHS0_9VIRU|nr:MAG: hypothetical protein Solumvirus1_9 [Solumvirus sp.]
MNNFFLSGTVNVKEPFSLIHIRENQIFYLALDSTRIGDESADVRFIELTNISTFQPLLFSISDAGVFYLNGETTYLTISNSGFAVLKCTNNPTPLIIRSTTPTNLNTIQANLEYTLEIVPPIPYTGGIPGAGDPTLHFSIGAPNDNLNVTEVTFLPSKWITSSGQQVDDIRISACSVACYPSHNNQICANECNNSVYSGVTDEKNTSNINNGFNLGGSNGFGSPVNSSINNPWLATTLPKSQTTSPQSSVNNLASSPTQPLLGSTPIPHGAVLNQNLGVSGSASGLSPAALAGIIIGAIVLIVIIITLAYFISKGNRPTYYAVVPTP